MRHSAKLPSKRVARQSTTPTYGLYSHQRTAVSRVTELLVKAPHKVLLHLPTGSGKTRTSIHVVSDHLRRKYSTVVCWLAHSSELLEQAASEFERAWCFSGS